MKRALILALLLSWSGTGNSSARDASGSAAHAYLRTATQQLRSNPALRRQVGSELKRLSAPGGGLRSPSSIAKGARAEALRYVAALAGNPDFVQSQRRDLSAIFGSRNIGALRTIQARPELSRQMRTLQDALDARESDSAEKLSGRLGLAFGESARGAGSADKSAVESPAPGTIALKNRLLRPFARRAAEPPSALSLIIGRFDAKVKGRLNSKQIESLVHANTFVPDRKKLEKELQMYVEYRDISRFEFITGNTIEVTSPRGQKKLKISILSDKDFSALHATGLAQDDYGDEVLKIGGVIFTRATRDFLSFDSKQAHLYWVRWQRFLEDDAAKTTISQAGWRKFLALPDVPMSPERQKEIKADYRSDVVAPTGWSFRIISDNEIAIQSPNGAQKRRIFLLSEKDLQRAADKLGVDRDYLIRDGDTYLVDGGGICAHGAQLVGWDIKPPAASSGGSSPAESGSSSNGGAGFFWFIFIVFLLSRAMH